MNTRSILIAAIACSAAACSSAKKDAAPVAPAATAAKTATAVADAKTAKAAPAQAAKAAPEAKAGEMSCARDKDVRTFAIESAQPKGCELHYTKFGNKEKVAWSEFGQSHCEQVRDRMKGNLESAGFQCALNQAAAKVAAPGPSPASVPTNAKAPAPAPAKQ